MSDKPEYLIDLRAPLVVDVLTEQLPIKTSQYLDKVPYIIICHNTHECSVVMHQQPIDDNFYHNTPFRLKYGFRDSHARLACGTEISFMNYEQFECDPGTFEGFTPHLIILGGQPPKELIDICGFRVVPRNGKVILI